MKDLVIGLGLMVVTIMIVGYSLSKFDTRTVWYLDSDGDGFGSATILKKSNFQPEGYSELNTDCHDNDITINPKHTHWHAQPYHVNGKERGKEKNKGSASFDYNCDGQEEPQATKIASCIDIDGWYQKNKDVPQCGELGLWLTVCEVVDGVEQLITESRIQKCR